MALSIFSKSDPRRQTLRTKAEVEKFATEFEGDPEQLDPQKIRGVANVSLFGILGSRDFLAKRQEELRQTKEKQEGRRKTLTLAGKRFGGRAARGEGAFGQTDGQKKVLLGGTK
jgi:hypothetical protein